MLEELRTYVVNDFNKSNYERRLKYFEKRFTAINGIYQKLETDYSRIVGLAAKVVSVDRTFKKLVDRDWGREIVSEVKREVEDIGNKAILAVHNVSGSVIGRIKVNIETLLNSVNT